MDDRAVKRDSLASRPPLAMVCAMVPHLVAHFLIMLSTYPLFQKSAPYRCSGLGRLGEPLERHLAPGEVPAGAMDREVRAHSALGPLFIKFRPARWIQDPASRQQHRELAWDAAYAALKCDVRSNFCPDWDEGTAIAWRAARMPRRGEPVRLTDARRLLRLHHYLFAFMGGKLCDGTEADSRLVRKRLSLVLGLYERFADRIEPPFHQDPQESVSQLAATAWHLLSEDRSLTVAAAIDQAVQSQMAPSASTTPRATDSPRAVRADRKQD